MHVLAPAPVGGLETVVRLLAAGHAAQGHDVVVCPVIENEPHPFVASIAECRGVALANVVVAARDYRGEGRRVAAIAREFGAEVIHTHGYRPDILHIRRARRIGAAAVTTLHGFTGTGWRGRMYERLQLRAARRASAAVAVSRGVKTRLIRAGVDPARVHVIPNAFAPVAPFRTRAEARAALGIAADGGPRVGWVGRLGFEKGPDVMVRALAAASTGDLSVSFIGDGAERRVVERLAAELGVAGRITMHGNVPGAASLLRAFDAIVLSSRTEGTPMIALEAMAAGVPVIATRVGGIPDMLDEREAWLVPPEDERALATAIDTAVADMDGAAMRAAAAASRLAREFGVEPWLDRYERLYESVTRRRTDT